MFRFRSPTLTVAVLAFGLGTAAPALADDVATDARDGAQQYASHLDQARAAARAGRFAAANEAIERAETVLLNLDQRPMVAEAAGVAQALPAVREARRHIHDRDRAAAVHAIDLAQARTVPATPATGR